MDPQHSSTQDALDTKAERKGKTYVALADLSFVH